MTGPLLHSTEYEQAIEDSCTDSEHEECMGRKPASNGLVRRKSQQKLIVKGPWTEAEDWKVLQLVEKNGPEKWTKIAEHL